MLSPEQSGELQRIADELAERLMRVSHCLKFLPKSKGKQAALSALDDVYELIDDIADVYIADDLMGHAMETGEMEAAIETAQQMGLSLPAANSEK